MHFSLATILAVVPLVLSAANTTQTPHVTIPLKRHGSLYRSDGSVDLEALKRNADYTTAYVIPPLTCESLLTHHIVRGFKGSLTTSATPVNRIPGLSVSRISSA
jgi:hypothetical protein